MAPQEVSEPTNVILPQLQSVARISKLPIVESALGVASGIYGIVKESNSVVHWTLSHAEGVGAAALAPVASRLETPIHAVDSILGRGIDIVEEKVPAIKMTPQEMIDSTKKLVVSGLSLQSSGPDSSVTARVVGAGMGVATTGLRSAVSVVEWYLDKNYPDVQPDEDNLNDQQNLKDEQGTTETEEAVQEPFKVFIRWQKVSRRMQRVVSSSVKRQREDIASFMGRMGEYLKDTHPKVLDKLVATYAEVAKTIQDKEASTKDMASKVAHQMTSLAFQILGDVGSGIASLPGGVVARIDDAQRYGMDVVRSVLHLGARKEAKEEAVNGCDSDEKARLLIARQDKGTSPPPEEAKPEIAEKTPTTAEKTPSSAENAPTSNVATVGEERAAR